MLEKILDWIADYPPRLLLPIYIPFTIFVVIFGIINKY